MKNKKKSADAVLKEFWQSNDRFADLFNTVVFEGEHVLMPKDLQEMDTTFTTSFTTKTRDLIKKSAHGIEFMILGLENQQKIHYAMPLRTMLYDSLSYYREYQELSTKYKQENPISTSDEFLSKMKKSDRLHPVITLVIYYGEIPWDGPCSLKDMMIDIPTKMQSKFSNYHMNLVQVRDSTHYHFQNEDVQTVFELSQLFLQGNQTQLTPRVIKRELVEVIDSIVGFKQISQFTEKEKGETINMCTLVDQIEQVGEKRGLERGLALGEKRSLELITHLIADNRFDDIPRITTDTQLYRQLLHQYQICTLGIS